MNEYLIRIVFNVLNQSVLCKVIGNFLFKKKPKKKSWFENDENRVIITSLEDEEN